MASVVDTYTGPAPGAAGTGETEQMRRQIQRNLDQMNNLLTEMKKCNARIGTDQDTDQSRRSLCVRAKIPDDMLWS